MLNKMLTKKHKYLYGFTLIELLIVIAIIGLLSSVVSASVNSARVKARDARRISDLKQIRLALEFYFNDHNRYPITNGWVFSTSVNGPRWITGLVPGYISAVPVDTINSGTEPWITGQYVYAYSAYDNDMYSMPDKYNLIAQLEDVNNENRCQIKCWKYHGIGQERPWCANCGGLNFSPYLYADH